MRRRREEMEILIRDLQRQEETMMRKAIVGSIAYYRPAPRWERVKWYVVVLWRALKGEDPYPDNDWA
ncbi:hypothetical protein LCGC14_2991150 [marine sediment metagenome]|uniref:Uncharacterized protein n=1 Tax=marine sediment metagenome TaxID=412755 RepID=A0A0F8ZUZ6_9ZZZZ